MDPPAIGDLDDVPALHPSSPLGAAIREKWGGGQRGRVVDLIDTGDCDNPDDPLACLEIAGEDGALHAWFLASGIRAGTLCDPELSPSVDAMVSEHRPNTPDHPGRLYDRHVFIFIPEEETWYPWRRYRGPPAD